MIGSDAMAKKTFRTRTNSEPFQNIFSSLPCGGNKKTTVRTVILCTTNCLDDRAQKKVEFPDEEATEIFDPCVLSAKNCEKWFMLVK